jgi:Domain of unknown function(DUF2779)
VTPLSKSRLQSHRQCPKRLWLEVNGPDLNEDSAATKASYAAGNRLGEVARGIFDAQGNGQTFDVMADGVASVIEQTQSAIAATGNTLATRTPLFEAGFEAAGARAFVDALLPVRGPPELSPRWAIVEVKSATMVKDVYLDDAAIQYFAATEAGLDLDCIAIAHVNNEWVYAGDGCYDGLLTTVDVTQEIQGAVLDLPRWIKAAQATLKQSEAPVMVTGAQCSDPYPCGFFSHCQSTEPVAEYPVRWLPRVQTKALRAHLAQPHVMDMRDVPDALLNPIQQRVKSASLSGRAYFDRAGAAKALAQYAGPHYFLDFETIADVVPRWKGTRPYQQIPFQFSLHRLTGEGKLEHAAFLDVTGNDPRLPLARALVEACGQHRIGEAVVFAYNAPFEAARIRELAEHVAGDIRLSKALLAINARLVDLAPITREHFYHPAQQGSWSLKAVLPALLPHLSYDELDGIKSGLDAQLAYAEAADKQTAVSRIHELQDQLAKYCELDTLALVELWRVLSAPNALRTNCATLLRTPRQ